MTPGKGLNFTTLYSVNPILLLAGKTTADLNSIAVMHFCPTKSLKPTTAQRDLVHLLVEVVQGYSVLALFPVAA